MVFNTCSWWGSNPRPMAHKTITLPTELHELFINKSIFLNQFLNVDFLSIKRIIKNPQDKQNNLTCIMIYHSLNKRIYYFYIIPTLATFYQFHRKLF